jgi:hypothetical protein
VSLDRRVAFNFPVFTEFIPVRTRRQSIDLPVKIHVDSRVLDKHGMES